MKGYAVEYTTPYKTSEQVFIPSDMYVSFLTCIKDQHGEVMQAVLTESVPEKVPVLDAASFGWVATVGNNIEGKRIFIPDVELNEVLHQIRTRGNSLTLLHWTNNVVSGLDYPIINESEV